MTDRKPKALLVEDDAIVRMFVVDLLQDMRIDVIECWDEAGALSSLRENPDIDLLVTDVSLSGSHGGVLAAQARRIHPALPVLFTTGHAQFQWADPVGEGAVEVLSKPIDVAAFEITVQRLLSR
jgi:CheY-like chemotaxis protein